MEIARILVDGDPHLSSKNRGNHRDYPKESLEYFRFVTEIGKQYGCTYNVNLGDFTFGRFHTIEYRQQVDEALKERQNQFTNGFYMIRGNHDIATYGKTEYEYYLERGAFKKPENISIGRTNISMVSFGEYNTQEPLITEDKYNILLTHGFYKFKNSELPPYGEAVILDDFSKWYGLNYIISGHIHHEHAFSGMINSADKVAKRECYVHYLPCSARPDYEGESTPSKGAVDIIRIFDDAEPIVTRVEIDLLKLEESFDIEAINKAKEHEARISVDVSDIVQELNNYTREVGDPIMQIETMDNIKDSIKQRAINLLKLGNEE